MINQQKIESITFWEGIRTGKLRYQFCEACSRAQFPPALLCKYCGSNKIKWLDSDGKGVILSITTVFRAPSLNFKDKTPYDLAIVELDEGFRIMTNVNPPMSGKIGSRIKITFKKQSDAFSLPLATLLGFDKN